jgi:AbrB family looped-hinge helix DNA binding protein
VNHMYIEVGKEGRIVLPKEVRERNKIEEKTRILVRERSGEIILIPINRYSEPTIALAGSLPLTEPIDEPKELAHRHATEKTLKRLEP